MKLQDILIIMQNRLLNLTEARKSALSTGNLEMLANIDADITSTELTVQQLKDALV